MGSPKLTGALPRTAAGGHRLTDHRLSELTQWAQTLARLVLATLACMVVASLAPLVIGWKPYVVLSGSMLPVLRPGDVVIASPPQRSKVIPGRIIVFAEPDRPDRLIVHRIKEDGSGGTLITKGDANSVPDSTPLPRDEVKGIARLRIPFIALPFYWLHINAWLPATAIATLLIALIGLAYYPTPDVEEDAGDGRLVDQPKRRRPRRPPQRLPHNVIVTFSQPEPVPETADDGLGGSATVASTAPPLRARRPTPAEGRTLQQVVRQADGDAAQLSRALIIMASASGIPLNAVARLAGTYEDTVREVIQDFNRTGPALPDGQASPHRQVEETGSEFDARMAYIEEVTCDVPDRCFAFGQCEPLSSRGDNGDAPTPDGASDEPPGHTPGCLHACYSFNDDQLWGVTRRRTGPDHTLSALKSIREACPDGEPIYVILDSIPPNDAPAIHQWAAEANVQLCYTPTGASWANPVEAQCGPLRRATMTDPSRPSPTVLARNIQRYLRDRNAGDQENGTESAAA